MGVVASLKRNRNTLLAYAVARATMMRGKRMLLGRDPIHTGITTRTWSVTESADYIERQIADHRQHGGLTPERLAGRTVLELGPGDNLGVGLLLVTNGARRYVAVDKVRTHRDETKEREIYQILRERLTATEWKRFDQAVDLTQGIAWNQDLIQTVYGTPAEDTADVLKEQFDVIISRAVLQEIPDGERLFKTLDRLLAPGGQMCHKLDLGDYRLFSSNGYHPLEYLTVPDSIYALLNRPSRRHLDFHRRQMERLGYDYRLLVASIVGGQADGGDDELQTPTEKLEAGRHFSQAHRDRIQAIRPRFVEPFRSMADEELLVRTFFLIATKPA